MVDTTIRGWFAKFLSDRTVIFGSIVLLATILASVVSFYATTQGLRRYFEIWVAVGMAGAVQLALFGLAWLVGLQRAAGSFRSAVLYLVVMTFSVTFSYVFFHSTLAREVRPAVQ